MSGRVLNPNANVDSRENSWLALQAISCKLDLYICKLCKHSNISDIDNCSAHIVLLVANGWKLVV